MGGEGRGAEGSVNLIQQVEAVQCFFGGITFLGREPE